jgi:hypothetical protein
MEITNKEGHEPCASEITMLRMISHIEQVILSTIHHESSPFAGVPTRTLIVMIVNNILLSLFLKSVSIESLEIKLKAAEELIDEIGDTFCECLERIETAKCDQSVAH